jgi:transposase-like protein
MTNLTDPIFHNEDAARAHLEKLRWPDGSVCPHCGSVDGLAKVEGKKQSHRPGLYYCNACQGQFTVRVGTVLERSKIPLAKWVLGFHLMSASKKGISAHQLHRSLGITYKTAWFMAHRIREAMGMKPEETGPIRGENKVIESDETYVGGKAKNAHKGKPIPKKHAVVALVERDGEVRASHVANVTANNMRNHLVTLADPKSYLMSDESKVYVGVG